MDKRGEERESDLAEHSAVNCGRATNKRWNREEREVMIRAVRRFFRSFCGWCARGHQSSDRRPRPNKRRKRKFYGAPFVIGRRRSPPSLPPPHAACFTSARLREHGITAPTSPDIANLRRAAAAGAPRSSVHIITTAR